MYNKIKLIIILLIQFCVNFITLEEKFFHLNNHKKDVKCCEYLQVGDFGIFKLRGENPVIYDLYKELITDKIANDDEMRFTLRKEKTLDGKAWYITSRIGMVSFNQNGKIKFIK